MELHYDPAIAEPFAALPSTDTDTWPLWGLIQQPILVLRGESSDLLSPAVAARMGERRGVRVVTFADCGHAPALQAREQIDAIRSFLA